MHDREAHAEEKEESSIADVESAPIRVTENGHKKKKDEKKRPSMLPAVTPELIREHEAQRKAASKAFPRGTTTSSDSEIEPVSCLRFLCPCHHEDENGEPAAVCGIPYYLFMIMAALAAAVTAGTVLAVVYYDPNAGLDPTFLPTPSPSMAANSSTISPSTVTTFP